MPNQRESCRFVNIEYSNLTLKYVLSSFANRPPERRIDFTNDESCRPVQIVSIRQHLIPLFNALGRKKVHFNIQNILTMDLRPFYALRKWKVYVVTFSFYPTFTFIHCSRPSTSGMLTHDYTSGVSIRQRLQTNRCGLGVLDGRVSHAFKRLLNSRSQLQISRVLSLVSILRGFTILEPRTKA